jgi:hypothetical protein
MNLATKKRKKHKRRNAGALGGGRAGKASRRPADSSPNFLHS